LILAGIFLWAFFDKVFGFGFATKPASAWLQGGSPTRGFLGASHGPFAGFYQAIAGQPATDALFMIALLAIGTALLLGIGLRIAGYAGAALMVMMWSAALPPTQNPMLDDHIVYAILLLALPTVHAGHTWGWAAAWQRTPLVQRLSVLA
jgi:thiosulfate dehydrogenase [quinone] large subunit